MKINISIFALLLCFFVACSSHKEDNNLYRILVGDKYGFMNAQGKVVIEPQFDKANLFFYEDVCFAEIGQKKGLIDRTGSFIVNIDSTIYSVTPAVKGLFVARGYWGRTDVIDKTGKVILKDIVDFPWRKGVGEDGDSIYAIKGKEWVIMDEYGNPPGENKLYVVRLNGDTIGEYYNDIKGGFFNGRCAVKKNNKWGYIDWYGNLVINTIYDDAYAFSDEGIARVRRGKEHYYIDKSGNQLFSVDSTITGFNHNRAAVVIKGVKCLINKKGEKICDLDYDMIYPFCDDNMATVVKNGKAMKIDTMGNIVLVTDYEFIGDFIRGIAIIQKSEGFWGGKKWGYIDITGKEIVEPTYTGGWWTEFDNKQFSLRALANNINGMTVSSYYDLQGNLIWQDIPPNSLKKELPSAPERKDFIEYYDTRMTELEPIEGIYYVTVKHYYQDRDNSSLIGTNGSESKFYAVVKNQDDKDFTVYCVDKPGYTWRNKFVQIGESNIFAIMADDDDVDKYSSEGRVTIEDPAKFDFQLDLGHNNYYNFYDTYEFIRDYPPMSIYEQLQKTEWTSTGFAIANGYVVTNYHVTNYAKTIRIKGINGDMKKSYKGFVVASDKEHDISIIRIVDKDFEEFGSIPYSIGKANVEVGDDVFVLGYPMTTTMGEEIKLTEGVISAASGYKGNESMYQISAAAQPGNSGGPLFNSEGAVIGIVNAKLADAENVNYAIKISYLYSLINSSDLGIDITGSNSIKNKSLSGKVKAVKNFVYLIECSSK